MKKTLLIVVLFITVSCAKSYDTGASYDPYTPTPTPTPSLPDPCGYHNGKKLYKGSQGGCYYINSNGNKTYVDRSECNCL